MKLEQRLEMMKEIKESMKDLGLTEEELSDRAAKELLRRENEEWKEKERLAMENLKSNMNKANEELSKKFEDLAKQNKALLDESFERLTVESKPKKKGLLARVFGA